MITFSPLLIFVFSYLWKLCMTIYNYDFKAIRLISIFFLNELRHALKTLLGESDVKLLDTQNFSALIVWTYKYDGLLLLL